MSGAGAGQGRAGQGDRVSRELVNQHCAGLPGAARGDPFDAGYDWWTVGGKMFATVGALGEAVSFKCESADQAAMLIDLGVAQPAKYLKRGGWVSARWDAMPEDELRERLTRSYLVVRRKLTKRAQAALGPEPTLRG